MPREPSADLLHDILEFIDRIERWTSAESQPSHTLDEKTLYAVLHALRYIGEASSRLPSTVTELAPEVPWAKIRGMRNCIVHDYAGIDANIVWETVKQRLPELRAAVETILQRLASD